jgi:NADH:ubiquinone oxidoreductase subunit 3 (subunit A)
MKQNIKIAKTSSIMKNTRNQFHIFYLIIKIISIIAILSGVFGLGFMSGKKYTVKHHDPYECAMKTFGGYYGK